MPVLNAPETATPPNASNAPDATHHALSSVQQVVWLDQILHPDAPIYNIGLAWQIRGEVDADLLRQAIQCVADNNDALRMALCDSDGMARQQILPSLVVALPVTDFSGEADADLRARAHMAAAFARPFDLNAGPLWTCELVRSDRCSYWLQRYHHLVIDGFGIALIVHAVADAYNRLLAGAAPADAGPSYLDFVAEDQQYLASARYARDGEFWGARFVELPAPLFACKSADAGARVAPSEQVCWTVPRAQYERMKDFAAGHAYSISHLMLAAIGAYFARVTGQGEIVVGTPSAQPRHGAPEADHRHVLVGQPDRRQGRPRGLLPGPDGRGGGRTETLPPPPALPDRRGEPPPATDPVRPPAIVRRHAVVDGL